MSEQELNTQEPSKSLETAWDNFINKLADAMFPVIEDDE